MNPEEYAAQQAVIAASTALFVQKVAEWFTAPLLSTTQWLNLLEFLFPFVQSKRDEATRLARTFYDSQRDLYHPELPRHDMDLESYTFDWFVENMEPARKPMQAPDAPKSAVTRLTLQVVRDVENAGRRQIIHAVESDKPVAEKVAKQRERLKHDPEFLSELRQGFGLEDPAPKDAWERMTWAGGTATEDVKTARKREPVHGWARVATGRETCAWCLMLISRGPVYAGAETAGVMDYLTDADVIDMYKADPKGFFTDIEPHLDEWHTGCDCKVVPVFDQFEWVGYDAQKKALDYWVKATKEAKKILRDDPDKQYYSREDQRWYDSDLNRETINALRRMIDGGTISTDWAAISLDSSPLAA